MAKVITFLGNLTGEGPSTHLMDFVPHIHRIEPRARILIVDTNPDDATSQWFNHRKARRETMLSIAESNHPAKVFTLHSTHMVAYLSVHIGFSGEFADKLFHSLRNSFDYILVDTVRSYLIDPASLFAISELMIVPTTPSNVTWFANSYAGRLDEYQKKAPTSMAPVLFVVEGFWNEFNDGCVIHRDKSDSLIVWRGVVEIQKALAERWSNLNALFEFVNERLPIKEALQGGLGTTEVEQSDDLGEGLESVQTEVTILNEKIWDHLHIGQTDQSTIPFRV